MKEGNLYTCRGGVGNYVSGQLQRCSFPWPTDERHGGVRRRSWGTDDLLWVFLDRKRLFAKGSRKYHTCKGGRYRFSFHPSTLHHLKHPYVNWRYITWTQTLVARGLSKTSQADEFCQMSKENWLTLSVSISSLEFALSILICLGRSEFSSIKFICIHFKLTETFADESIDFDRIREVLMQNYIKIIFTTE